MGAGKYRITKIPRNWKENEKENQKSLCCAPLHGLSDAVRGLS